MTDKEMTDSPTELSWVIDEVIWLEFQPIRDYVLIVSGSPKGISSERPTQGASDE